MRRALLPALLALALLAPAAAPAPAAAAPVIGMGEQSPLLFSEPSWTELGLRDVRRVVSWDAASIRFERNELDTYMAEAERTGSRVLVAFVRSRVSSREKVLPSPARYRRAFRAFRRRWPYARAFTPWNEANHCSQPTCHRPDRAAAYFDVIRSECPTCTAVAADVLDLPTMASWLKAFRMHARHKPRIWGLHNYLDANRFTTAGTRALLRTVRGQVWFTETGGIVKRNKRRKIHFEESTRHAARATRWVFSRLVPLSPRIRRVYLYHWIPPADRRAQWDSALLDRHGKPRPAYTVLRTYVRRVQRAQRDRRGG